MIFTGKVCATPTIP